MDPALFFGLQYVLPQQRTSDSRRKPTAGRTSNKRDTEATVVRTKQLMRPQGEHEEAGGVKTRISIFIKPLQQSVFEVEQTPTSLFRCFATVTRSHAPRLAAHRT